MNSTECKIGAEGANKLSELLKINDSLTELNLGYMIHEMKQFDNKEKRLVDLKKTDNDIRAEGANAISELLKINSTLTELNLAGN